MIVQKHCSQIGESLIEILFIIALISLMLPILFYGFISANQGKPQQNQRLIALSILKETEEALRNIREAGWINLPVSGTYHPTISGSTWILNPNSEVLENGFTRSIQISSVYRNTEGTIVPVGGTLDPSTRKIEIMVSWTLPFPSSVTSVGYITRYLENMVFTQTTYDDFNSGTKTSITIATTSGSLLPGDAQIQLANTGVSDWCQPNLSITALDLPKNGQANTLYAIEGNAFAGTGENSSGISFAKININNSNPPVATLADTFDGYKTNNVFGETTYAYLATDNNSKEVVIIDLTQVINGKYVEVGSFNASGNADGNYIFVSNNKGYLLQGSDFRIFDLSNKTEERLQLGSLSIGATGNSVVVVGNYAYITRENNSAEQMIIVDVSDSASPVKIGQASVNGQSGKNLFVNPTGTRAYLVTASSVSQPEFFIIDISTKTGNRTVLGSYETNGMNPKGVTVVTFNKAILVGNGAEEYQVLDITNEASPARCGGLNIDTGINAVSSVLESDGDTFSYIVTNDATTELKIIEGGAGAGGGGNYSDSGIYESSTFDSGYQTAFNYFSSLVTQPSQTTLRMQIAIAESINESCSNVTFTYIGPDTSNPPASLLNSYFTPVNNEISSSIPTTSVNTYSNPGRCIRYKVFLTTSDSTQTPVFNEVNINYSP